jgi:hypothetical protein
VQVAHLFANVFSLVDFSALAINSLGQRTPPLKNKWDSKGQKNEEQDAGGTPALQGQCEGKGKSKRDPFPHSHPGREQRASAGERDLSALLRRVLQKAGGLQNRALQETGGLKHRALHAEETKRRESARLKAAATWAKANSVTAVAKAGRGAPKHYAVAKAG